MRSCLTLVVLCLSSLAVAAFTPVASAQQPLPNGEVFVGGDDLSAFKIAGSGASKAEVKEITVSGRPFKRAWRVNVKEKVGDYNVQLASPLSKELKKGDVILFSAWGRMIETADESGEGRVGFVLEQAKDPYSKVFAAPFGLTRQWQRFDIPAVVDQDFSQTGGQFTIRLGAYVQVIEIGGVTVRLMPAGTKLADLPRSKVSYPGREANAPWRKAAEERIEQIRKAELAITVVDSGGKPIANATVDVQMKRHAFVFGSCYAPRFILDSTLPDAKQYQEHFLKLFNTGTDEWQMKWPGWVDANTRANAMKALEWMEAHDIDVRGHTMVWPGWKRIPEKIKGFANDPAELRKQIEAHIRSVGTTFKGRVIDWDVVNEPFVNNDLLKILGEEAMAEWFKIAHEVDPSAKLYLNETSVPTSPPNDERYTALYNRAKMIQDKGARIDGVGMQAHFGQNVQPPVQLLGIYDRFAKLGIPVRITELDIDTSDEDLQADYYRDFLTASFSHENINGILIWGFWEGAHWRPNAAMYRKDWSPRPIAFVWNDLLFKQWWTSVKGPTASDGTYRTRGFLGAYEITVTANGKSKTVKVDLAKVGVKQRITLD